MITRENVLKLKARQEIRNLISKNPGLHIREISRKMDIPKTTLTYHLNYLEKRGLIIGKYDDVYNRFYITNTIGITNKKILSFMRRKTTRNILLVFLSYIGVSRIELSRELEKSPRSIAFHLKRLLDADIIEQAPVGDGIVHRLKHSHVIKRPRIRNEIIYRLKNPKLIYDLFITHRKSLDEETINKFMAVLKWISLGGTPKKLIGQNDCIDEAAAAIFEVFPHPYHV
jgi:DNA-binding transcriptional ArsR family regulator